MHAVVHRVAAENAEQLRTQVPRRHENGERHGGRRSPREEDQELAAPPVANAEQDTSRSAVICRNAIRFALCLVDAQCQHEPLPGKPQAGQADASCNAAAVSGCGFFGSGRSVSSRLIRMNMASSNGR